jgi:hypothetical protein
MASQISKKELEDLENNFKLFDMDASGSIDEKEVITVLKNLGIQTTPKEVEQMIASVDSNRNGQVEWDEFLQMYKGLKEGKTTAFGSMYTKAEKQIKIKGEGGSEHSYTVEEKEAFVDHINMLLANDKDLAGIIPLDPQSEDFFSESTDGVLLSKLINACVPDTIDERVLNKKKKKNKFEVVENLNLMLGSAKAIGCSVVNVGQSDIMEGRKHLILGLVWQIIKIGLLSKINLQNCPQLVRLLNEGEELSDLLKLPADQLLIRWVNYQLREGGTTKRQINNFTTDIRDSEAYTHLLHRICPNKECDLSPMKESDTKQRAEKMLQQADKIKCRKFVTPRDVVNGNGKLNLAYVAHLFNNYPCLEDVDLADYAGLLDFDQEGTREERAFRFWIQSLGFDCTNLFEDMRDGLLLLKVIDAVQPGTVNWKIVSQQPNHVMKKVGNCNEAVNCGQNKLKFSMVNIGGKDIVDGNKKLILGFTWQLMRLNILNMLKALSKDGKPISEPDMIKWANAKAVGPQAATMRDFKDSSLKNGIFLINLCNGVRQGTVNYDLVTPGETDDDAAMNAKYAVSVARKLGATLFLLWEDIVEVKPKMILTYVGGLMQIAGGK